MGRGGGWGGCCGGGMLCEGCCGSFPRCVSPTVSRPPGRVPSPSTGIHPNSSKQHQQQQQQQQQHHHHDNINNRNNSNNKPPEKTTATTTTSVAVGIEQQWYFCTLSSFGQLTSSAGAKSRGGPGPLSLVLSLTRYTAVRADASPTSPPFSLSLYPPFHAPPLSLPPPYARVIRL